MGHGASVLTYVVSFCILGLIYICGELYIDDVLIYGKSEEEFLSNLRLVFIKFRLYNITANPNKTKLGLEQV
jgi:hypothetical protein